MTTKSAVSKSLPMSITSYDLLKTFAVIIMIVDHTGAYFFPYDPWLRAVGRIGFPVWFFLIGYSSGRSIPPKLLWGAIIIAVTHSTLMCFQLPIVTLKSVWATIWPLNALFTIIFIRLVIDKLMALYLKNTLIAWAVGIGLTLLILPTYAITEYGTQALITAMFGYAIRHKDRIDNDNMVYGTMAFALISFVFFQYHIFSFSQAQFIVMALGTFCVRGYLCFFKAQSYPALTEKLPKPMTFLIQIGGRKTLEVYVVHLILFKIIALFVIFQAYSIRIF